MKKLHPIFGCFVAAALCLSSGCTGSKPGATPPANIADFPGEDTQDGGGSSRPVVDVDIREEEDGG